MLAGLQAGRAGVPGPCGLVQDEYLFVRAPRPPFVFDPTPRISHAPSIALVGQDGWLQNLSLFLTRYSIRAIWPYENMYKM